MSRIGFALLGLAGVLSVPGIAQAETYSLPWQLRPVTIGSSLARVDGAVAAFNDESGNLDVAFTSGLSLSYRFSDEIAPMLRLGFAQNNAPGAALDGSSLANPLVGVSYGRSWESFKWSLFGGTTVPIGSGGGDEPDAAAARTNLAAMVARPADDTLYAVNYLTPMLGGDFAYVNRGFTAQAEVTVQELIRVRGGKSPSGHDRLRTNAALGLHLGYFIGAHFSVGGDVRFEHWISHPIMTARSTTTLALGPRLHFKLGSETAIHPGLSLMRGFDSRASSASMVTRQTTAVQLDIPVAF